MIRRPCLHLPTTVISTGVANEVYLEVSVNNVQGVEVGDSLQHLANDVAGVPLRVVTLIQDPVEHLSACGTGERDKSLTRLFKDF